jgi:hypothetical protein
MKLGRMIITGPIGRIWMGRLSEGTVGSISQHMEPAVCEKVSNFGDNTLWDLVFIQTRVFLGREGIF